MPTLPDNQIVQNVAISRADLTVPTIILDGLTNTNGNPHQFPSSSFQYNIVKSHPMSRVPLEQERLIPYNLNGQSGTVLKRVNQQPSKPNQGAGNKPVLQPTSGHPVSSLPFKRKAITENQGPQKMAAPNKRVTQVGSYSTYSSASPVSVLKKNSSKASGSGRKVVQIEPVISESRSNNMKKNVQPQVSPKVRTESSDSVRAKLRESLASALALVSQAQESSPDGKMNLEKETVKAVQDGPREHKSLDCPSSNGAAPLESPVDGKLPMPPPAVDDKILLSYQSKEIFGEVSQTESFLGTDFQCNSVLPGDDSLFSSGLYFKDDFLQGNGLSWESELSLDVPKLKENESTVKHEPMDAFLTSDVEKKTVQLQLQSPESVALAIEAELCKMFGGVNKKYKEKGRSLLFNLKDRNNPELRERVMSGDLPPDRLCSMTAEELASRELSQWRIAKAEELDNMKVLPDTDINMRRLVKKTHKGEYQVDFDIDSGVLEDTPVEATVVPSKRSKVEKFDGVATSKSKRAKADQCEITIPSDGADMQGLMGDDLNDLPPVISLDEFMESLNQDPPFENLPVDSVTTRGESDKENVELGSRNLSPTGSPKVQKMSSEKIEVKKGSPKIDGDKNLTGHLKRFDTNSAVQALKRESVWEGQMQISLSSTANFMVLYKSGEKTSCKEWASFFDIKGRVKHVAFEKFLKELPMSRSRAIMVTHFVLNEGTDSELASLKEFVDSYIADERVGFAEPGNGVELYLCAPGSKSVDMIVNHLPKSYTDKLKEIDDGLIGIVVWRKVQITSSSSAMSPVSSSQPQPQPVVKNQIRAQFVDNNDMNRNNVFAPKRASPPPIVSNSQPIDDEDDDDAPPGFGPPGPRDDDDLPEFHFLGRSRDTGFHHHSRGPPLSGLELIQKYGQNGNNPVTGSRIPTEPWNDDDDDIPEWQPQPVRNHVLPTHIVNHPPHMVMNQQTLQRPQWPPVVHPGQPLQPLQPPMGVQHQRAWGLYGQTVGSLPPGQFLGPPGPGSGMDWRAYDYNSRNG